MHLELWVAVLKHAEEQRDEIIRQMKEYCKKLRKKAEELKRKVAEAEKKEKEKRQAEEAKRTEEQGQGQVDTKPKKSVPKTAHQLLAEKLEKMRRRRAKRQ